MALILFSGGTSGKPKGIELTNLNMNALSVQTINMGNCVKTGQTQLCVLPMFHGFGLGVGVHTSLTNGVCCLLVPRFSVKKIVGLMKKKKFALMAGVPALFEKLMHHPGTEKLDLSNIAGVFCGGDSLTPSTKRRVDAFLAEHNGKVGVREGYGLTECVTVCCLNPYNRVKEGSIGIPSPDNYIKIVAVGSETELPPGEEGEICFTGPTLMKGYLNNPEETASTLRLHADGHVWLHTGDIGSMDEEGYVYFRQRLKQVIVISGYNVYPSQIEAAVQELSDIVKNCCVIGRRDTMKGEVPVIFAELIPSVDQNAARERILSHCREKLSSFAVPREVIFLPELPKTNVGKVDFKKLRDYL